MLAQVLRIFFGKEHLVKNRLISTLDKVLYFKGTIFLRSTKRLFTSKNRLETSWKNCPFFNMRLLDLRFLCSQRLKWHWHRGGFSFCKTTRLQRPVLKSSSRLELEKFKICKFPTWSVLKSISSLKLASSELVIDFKRPYYYVHRKGKLLFFPMINNFLLY
jgi:hypothetical protein